MAVQFAFRYARRKGFDVAPFGGSWQCDDRRGALRLTSFDVAPFGGSWQFGTIDPVYPYNVLM